MRERDEHGAMKKKYQALATDYDGTIAFEGCVDQDTLDALRRAKTAGVVLVMVTGRELSDLFNTFPHYTVFDRIVGENGAVLFNPSTSSVRTLAPPPPPALVALLQEQRIPLSIGHSVVATIEPHDRAVATALERLGLDWHVTYNKGSVMALPSGVTKATGLDAALAELGLPLDAVVGVGDAENDEAFLQSCGLSAAVANALPHVKAMAQVVTKGARGQGVAELIDTLLQDELF
jgi:hydroxymethylpyrimidine pyrophosphatase-like HAD family hydrolase